MWVDGVQENYDGPTFKRHEHNRFSWDDRSRLSIDSLLQFFRICRPSILLSELALSESRFMKFSYLKLSRALSKKVDGLSRLDFSMNTEKIVPWAKSTARYVHKRIFWIIYHSHVQCTFSTRGCEAA